MTATTSIPRWIPQGSQEIQHPEGLGVVYAYEKETGPMKVWRFLVCAYTRKAKKPTFHESYVRADGRDKRIADFFAGLTAHEANKRKHREESNRPHTLKPGDILHHSWGWEQTNCDYYQVLSVTAHRATIQAIGDSTVEGSTYQHGMADMRLPVADDFHGEPITVKVDGYNRVCVSDGVLSHGSCSKWDGKPNYCSWYA